ncbi:hypothetical protein XELAEV_18036666mg, partial [Xenopus laevis]
MEKVQSDLQNVKATLTQREEEKLCLQSEIHALEESNRTLEAAIAELRLEAEKNRRKIKELEKDLEAECKRGRTEKQEQEQLMANIQDQLNTAQSEVEQLDEYRQNYENLHR